MKPVQITNWAVVLRLTDPYTPPELKYQCLNGVVNNHPNQPDGKIVTTSAIVGKCDGMVLTSSGTLYQLGDVRAEYEQQFQNAAIRLLESLPERWVAK